MGSACRLAVTGAFRLLAHDDRVPHLHLAHELLQTLRARRCAY
jgi:hypothetical protein